MMDQADDTNTTVSDSLFVRKDGAERSSGAILPSIPSTEELALKDP